MSGPRTKRQEAPQCLLCKARIEESTASGLWLHAEPSVCEAKITDRYGVSLDERYELIDGEIFEKDLASEAPSFALSLDNATKAEEASAPEDRADFKIHLPVISGGFASTNSGLNFSLSIPNFTNHEEAIGRLFKKYDVEKLGGASGDHGWS